MLFSFRSIGGLALSACALVGALGPRPAAAQAGAFPSKPVRMIASFSPGGSVDATARFLVNPLSEAWGQSLVVENKPGADGNIAAEFVARSAADGYTVLITSNSISVTPALRKLPFDPLNDLQPIMRVLSIPNFLVVHPSLPVSSVGELIALARSKPGELGFASSGTGTTPFLGMALLMNITGIRMTHVPHKGTAPAVLSTLGNQTQLMFGDLNSTVPHIRSGKLKALGVSSLQRSPLAPDIPTIAESGLPGFETATWIGIFVPGGTPKSVAEKLHRDLELAMRSPEFAKSMAGMGAQPAGDGPAEFAKVMREDIARWTELVKAQGIRASD